MKKIILSISAACLLIAAAVSCDSMLDEVNYGNPTTEEMMTNEANVALLVGQAYAEVKWLHDHWGYWGVVTLTADEGLCPVRGTNWNDGGYWRNLNTHNWNSMGNAFKNIWNTTISGAVLCNKLIKTLETYKESMSEQVFAQYIGELEVMRSYYYYMLFDCFGRIPYLETFDEESSEPLMEPEKVWSRLVDCLEKNAPNLPVVSDGNRALNYGRATQGFAYALLARLYLNAESFGCTPSNIDLSNTFTSSISSPADFYTNCVRCCDAIIDAGSYSIEKDWFSNFAIENEASKENIFVIVENGVADFDERSYGGQMMNKLRIINNTLTYKQQESYGLILDTWNGFCARSEFIDRYAASDVRGPGNEGKGTLDEHRWGWFLGPVYDAAGEKVLTGDSFIEKELNAEGKEVPKQIPIVVENTLHEDDLANAETTDGARMLKYEVDKAGKCKYNENDFVLFRYADVLWMKEEAILRGGAGVSGVSSADFKAMQARVFAYDDDPAAAYAAAYPSVLTLEGICAERGREFAWENMRRRDLIRFGEFENVQYVTARDKYRRWFPIPFSVLEKSVRDENGNAVWTQNPGYDGVPATD